jgi:hypothetical protein
MKTGWYWHKNIQEDQWFRIEDPGIKPCIYSQLIFNKEAKTQKRLPFQQMLLGRLKKDPFHPVPKSTQSGSKTLI